MLFTIEGQCPAKKSSHVIRRKGSRSWIAPDDEYQAWELDAAKQLMCQKVELGMMEALTHPVHVKFLIYRSGVGRADLTNLIQSCEDALEKGAVILNDYLIESTDGSRRIPVPVGEERIEIEIRPFHPVFKMHYSVKEKDSMEKKQYEINEGELETLADDLLIKLCFMLDSKFCTKAFKTRAKMILKQALKDIFTTAGVKLK